MKLVVGLGNPGDKRSLRPSGFKYAGTRHNLGFRVLDEYAKKCLPSTVYSKFWKYENKFKAEVGRLKSEDILLVKPQTYMNNSGLAVKLLTTYYKSLVPLDRLPATNLIVIHDELDLPLGKIKVRMGGAAAGHHGVESIIAALGTDKFVRVRVGIGNLRTLSGEHKGQTIGAEKFVLESFMPKEKPQVKHMVKQAIKALDLLLEKGLERAQNQFN